MHRIAALFVVIFLVISGGGNLADPVPVTPAPLLPIPGTPPPSDPLGGFRGLQPTPAVVTPAAPNASRLPDITYVEDFAEPIVDLFGEEVVPHTAPFGQQAFLLTTQRAIHMPYSYVEEVHLRAHIRVEAGSAYFTLRESGAGAYVVRLDSAGQVTLSKSGAPLASAQVSGPEWFSTGTDLSIHISGSVVTVAVGTSRLIEYADPTPLPYGVLTFGAIGPDSVRVWISSLSLEARTASDLDAGARVIEAAIAQQEARITVVGLPPNTVDRVYFHREVPYIDRTTQAIYSSPADPTSGGEAIQVAFHAYEGTISPDGTRLAYVSGRDGAWRVWIKNADGTIQRLTPRMLGPEQQTYQGGDRTPSWSPNGREIVFVRDDQNLAHDKRDHLYVVDADTRQIKQYVLPGWLPDEPGNNSQVFEPVFDSTGNYIAAVIGDNTVSRRRIARIDRHEVPNQNSEYTPQILVTWNQLNPPQPLSQPEFSPDGTLLAFLGTERVYIRVLTGLAGPTTPTPTPSPTPTGTPTPPPVTLFSFLIDFGANDLAWHPDSRLADPSSLFLALEIVPSPSSPREIWYAQPDFGTGTLIWAEKNAGDPPEPTKISIEDAEAPISWAGTTDFATSRTKCVSVVVPNGLAAHAYLFPISTDLPPAATYVPPNRVHAVGQVAMPDGVWVEIDGHIPDFEADRTPTFYPTPGVSPWTHYWVRAADLPVDLCDDDLGINVPQQGFVDQVQHLPVVDFLTPTPFTVATSPLSADVVEMFDITSLAPVTHPIRPIPYRDAMRVQFTITNPFAYQVSGWRVKLFDVTTISDGPLFSAEHVLALQNNAPGGTCCINSTYTQDGTSLSLAPGQSHTFEPVFVWTRATNLHALRYELTFFSDYGTQVFTQTAYPLALPQPHVTRIVFDDAMKKVIFWGVFFETSEDEYFSGNPNDLKSDYYTGTNPVEMAAFLNDESGAKQFCPGISPLIDPLRGTSQAIGERIGVDAGWDADIIYISHCNPIDHRQFYAHGIINNLLLRERLSGTSRAMEYFSPRNWSESYADPTNDVWLNNSCSGQYELPYNTYEEAWDAGVPGNSYVSRVAWLAAYLDCQVNAIGPRGEIYRKAWANIGREIELAFVSLSIDPTGGVTTLQQFNTGRHTASLYTTIVPTPVPSHIASAYAVHIEGLRVPGPTLPTILRPALRAELERVEDDGSVSYIQGSFRWVSFTFQRTPSTFYR